jgi:hypothetical protein
MVGRGFSAALAVTVLGVGGMLSTTGAGAQATVRYSLSARGDAVGVILSATRAPLSPTGELAYVTPSSSQAILDSLGTSRAFASAPNVGDFIITLPGTVTGLGAAIGAIPPIPTPPFYVESDVTAPQHREELGPYFVEARSSDTSSSAEARIGVSTLPPQLASATTRASVSVDPESGVIEASAVAEIAPFSVSGLVGLGDIRSSVLLRYDPANPDAGVTKSSSTSIGTITVAGIELGLTDNGLVAAGTSLLPIDLATLTQLLKGAGIGFTYIPAVETPTSLTSAALELTYVQELPAIGSTTVTLILGKVSATASPTDAVGRQASGAPAPSIAATPSDGGSVLPDLGTSITPGGSPITDAPTLPTIAAVARPVADVHRFYLILVAGGLVAAAMSQVGVVDRLKRRFEKAS